MELIDEVTIPDNSEEYYFSLDTMVHVLKNHNYDTSAVETPYVQKCQPDVSLSVQSIPDLKMKKADSELSIKVCLILLIDSRMVVITSNFFQGLCFWIYNES